MPTKTESLFEKFSSEMTELEKVLKDIQRYKKLKEIYHIEFPDVKEAKMSIAEKKDLLLGVVKLLDEIKAILSQIQGKKNEFLQEQERLISSTKGIALEVLQKSLQKELYELTTISPNQEYSIDHYLTFLSKREKLIDAPIVFFSLEKEAMEEALETLTEQVKEIREMRQEIELYTEKKKSIEDLITEGQKIIRYSQSNSQLSHDRKELQNILNSITKELRETVENFEGQSQDFIELLQKFEVIKNKMKQKVRTAYSRYRKSGASKPTEYYSLGDFFSFSRPTYYSPSSRSSSYSSSSSSSFSSGWSSSSSSFSSFSGGGSWGGSSGGGSW